MSRKTGPSPTIVGLVLARSAGICEVCGLAWATNVHHRKNRSGGGTWAVSNLLHLCGSGTTGCHGVITCKPWEIEARPNGLTVHPNHEPAAVPVRLLGDWWLLDDHGDKYPTEAPS